MTVLVVLYLWALAQTPAADLADAPFAVACAADPCTREEQNRMRAITKPLRNLVWATQEQPSQVIPRDTVIVVRVGESEPE